MTFYINCVDEISNKFKDIKEMEKLIDILFSYKDTKNNMFSFDIENTLCLFYISNFQMAKCIVNKYDKIIYCDKNYYSGFTNSGDYVNERYLKYSNTYELAISGKNITLKKEDEKFKFKLSFNNEIYFYN